MKKQVKIALVLLFIGLIAAIVIGYKWLENRKLYASTDAFFVKSDKIANVSFKRISGKIVKMNFKEGDSVKAGDIMAEIDSTDYQTQLEKINHNINSLLAEKDALTVNKDKTEKSLKIEKNIKNDTLKSVEKEIESFKQNINEVDIQLSQLEKDYNRYKNLKEEKAISEKSFEDIQTNLKRLKAKKASLSEKLKSLYYSKQIAEKDLALVDVKLKIIFELEKKLQSLDEQISALKKDREDIVKMIEYCKLKAPFDGVIGQKYAEEGSVVKAGSYIYSLVDTTNLYGYVLMEEEKINGVNPGDVAEIKIDAYPDEKFEGEVVEVFPASAATYALVPRDISAGEFTKVSQRIPIRIKFTSGNLQLLRVGLGGEIKIKR
ncbi:HlyD family secretion protein [Deferribacterales bacterium Es71-Z0220]|uniref:HlyD family secretion protein n=1 Tax=Deferrivibrio essentukiensis TaxID=2880922 RepID=UPI001F61BFE1|nr:HlyD family secretion protein [Deferrivibrio essentukiensis]MCB4203850.1 HlyD family secretion protein [Deferrivibrio essentukiensis]